MKGYIFGLCLLTCSMMALCQKQKPEYDTTTNNITGFGYIYQSDYTQSLVNIQAGSESGQGLLVGNNLVLTSYSLIAGKSDVRYVDVSGRSRYFDGYVVADPSRGIILLKTKETYSQFTDLYSNNGYGSVAYYDEHFFLMHKDGNKYTIDSVKLPRVDAGEGSYLLRVNNLRKAIYAGTRPIQGYIDMNAAGSMTGMIVYINGEPFHVNNRTLFELGVQRDLTTKNLADLSDNTISTNNPKSKPSIHKIGLKTESSNKNGEVTLDYVKKDQQKLSLHFTFNPLDKKYSSNNGKTYVDVYGSNYNPLLSLIDLKSGIIYHPSSTENLPTLVYNNTSSRAVLHFDNIPASVNQVKLCSLPLDIYKMRKSAIDPGLITYDKYFDNVIIDNFPTTKKTHYELDEDFSNEGTVAFYCLESSKMTDDVKLSIDGESVGTLTHYFTDKNISDFCGRSSSVTVKLKPGEYKYKAVMGRNKIERKFIITKGKCFGQLIKF